VLCCQIQGGQIQGCQIQHAASWYSSE